MVAARTKVGALLAAVVVALTTSPPDAVADGPSPRSVPATAAVLGYVESGDGVAVLRRDLGALTSVGVDGVNITASGSHVSAPDRAAWAMLGVVHRAHKTAELLVGNYSDALGDFDPAAAHELFSSARHRATVIAALAADARRGWNGIQLDFESLRGSDRGGLATFTAELRAALPRRASLSMAVMASTTVAGYRDDGYDLSALARQLTRVVLMAYDQHGPTWTGPGPVGGLPWARTAMQVMLRSVPRSKAVLGVAGYGYTWPARGTGTQLSDAACRRAALRPVWDLTRAEWHSGLRGGGSIWWSDARSLRVRRVLARRLGVSGVAVWSLGLSDPIRT